MISVDSIKIDPNTTYWDLYSRCKELTPNASEFNILMAMVREAYLNRLDAKPIPR